MSRKQIIDLILLVLGAAVMITKSVLDKDNIIEMKGDEKNVI